jgi:hypothetical protein
MRTEKKNDSERNLAQSLFTIPSSQTPNQRVFLIVSLAVFLPPDDRDHNAFFNIIFSSVIPHGAANRRWEIPEAISALSARF